MRSLIEFRQRLTHAKLADYTLFRSVIGNAADSDGGIGELLLVQRIPSSASAVN